MYDYRYDDLVYGYDEHFVGAQYFLQTLAPSSLFNWNIVYAYDKDMCDIVKVLSIGKSSIVPTTVIDTVQKGYKEHHNKGILTIAGD